MFLNYKYVELELIQAIIYVPVWYLICKTPKTHI